MENENKFKVYAKKLTIPILIFIFSATTLFFLINFVINAIVEIFKKTLLTGNLLQPEAIRITSDMIYKLNYIETVMFLYPFIAFVSVVAGAFLVYKYVSNFGKLKKDQKGSSRFATFPEIKKQYRQIPEIKERFNNGGGVPVARYKKKIFIDDSAVNNLIIGTTRSGKGETFIFPTIDIYSRAKEQASMIINDPKGELFSASKTTLEGLGYKVEVLNLMNPIKSMSYNLLQLTIDAFLEGNFSLAQQYARSVAFMLYNDPTAKDKFWANSSTDLCTALILGLCEQCKYEPEKINMYNVALMLSDLATRMVEDEDGNEISAIDDFFNQFPENHPAKMQYATINFSGGQTRASILANTNAKLGVFTLDGTAKLTSQNTLDMTKFGFNHWIKGKSKPLSRIKVTFPSKKTETLDTDSDGGFSLYHNHHLEIGDTFEIKSNKQVTTFTVNGWLDENEGIFKISNDNDNVVLTSVMQFEKPLALFMIVPDYDPTFNVIASLYVKQVYTTLARTASNVKSGKCFREVIFLLDEFGNMPPIDDLASILTVCLGRKIRFNLVIQAYSQIEKLYGEDWKTIDGNCNNTFYLLTSDYNTAEAISKKLGDKTITTKSRSGQTISLDKSKTENLDSRALLNPTEVMGLREGEMIVIRTIKRQDNKRNRIKQYPLFLTGKTQMKYRWEYLSEYYDTDKSINEINIKCTHANKDLDVMKVNFETNNYHSNKLKETEKEQILEVPSKHEAPSNIQDVVKANNEVEDIAFSNSQQEEKELLLEKDKPSSDDIVAEIKREKMRLRNEERKRALQLEKALDEKINKTVKVKDIFNDKFLTIVFNGDFEEYKDMGVLDFKELLISKENEISENNYVFMLEKIQKTINQFHTERNESVEGAMIT
ncbi:MAG: VirD4-like conjugal transfer protein, CD1115 family [Bacillaceae bacterium]